MPMTPKIFYLTMILGAVLSNILSADEVLTFSEHGKEIKLNYSTIGELKVIAAAHLKSLDQQITEKKKASENKFNPFREDAKIRGEQLIGERERFLQLAWNCPYRKKCDNCDGGKKQWWVGDGLLGTGPCKKCHGRNNYTFDVNPHPAPDTQQQCGIPLGKLLGIGKAN